MRDEGGPPAEEMEVTVLCEGSTWTRKIHEGDLHESDPSGGAGAGEKLTKATDMKATDRRRLT